MNILKALDKWQAKRKTYRELSSLDDRALRDLGISRGDIRNIANGVH